MELIALLWALYLAQCLIHLPRGAVLFRRGRSPDEGPGWRLGSGWPSRQFDIGERSPWVERQGQVRWRGVAPRFFGADVLGAKATASGILGGEQAAADGALVRVDGAAVYRSASHRGAAAVAGAVRSGEPPGDRVARLLAAEASVEGLRSARTEVDTVTRWLRLAVDVLGFLALIGLPGVAAAIGIEPALARMAPVLAALHLLGVLVFAQAHRRLFPGERGALALAVFEVAVYPPALLRSSQKLRTEFLGRRHPAAVAVATLDEPAAMDFLRRELVSTAVGAQGNDGSWVEPAEQRALAEVLRAAGSSRERLLSPPDRVHDHAVAYCPSCWSEFSRGDSACSECRIEVVEFPDIGSKGDTAERPPGTST